MTCAEPEIKHWRGLQAAADLDPESELRARSGWLMALLLRKPEDENVARCAQRLDALIDGERDPNLRVLAGATVFNYINWKTEGEAAPSLIARIEPILAKPDVSPLMQVQWRTHLSFWHYARGRYGECTRAMGGARAIAERYGLEAYVFDVDHAEHRARGDFVFMRSRPDWAARLANHALEHGIETEFVRALIKRDALAAPPDAGPNWPFRLRVRVLGGFGPVRDGLPVRFTGKAQQRPLDLLKLVVALGKSWRVASHDAPASIRIPRNRTDRIARLQTLQQRQPQR